MPYNQGYPPAGTGVAMGQQGDGAGYPPQQNGTYSPWNVGQIPQPQPADYQSVQNFSDDAYTNARRYLDPQQEQQQRRLNQEQINRGIAPNSVAGGEMSDNLMMQQGDQDIAAAFGALNFGQGIQNQLYNQNIAGGGLQLGRQQQDFNELMAYDNMDYRNADWNENNRRWDQGLAMQLAGMPLPNMGSLGQGGGTAATSTNPVTPWSSFYGNTRETIGR